MKKAFTLFLSVLCLSAGAQPPIIRNNYTTNSNPALIGNASGLTNLNMGALGHNLIPAGSVYTNDDGFGFPSFGITLATTKSYLYVSTNANDQGITDASFACASGNPPCTNIITVCDSSMFLAAIATGPVTAKLYELPDNFGAGDVTANSVNATKLFGDGSGLTGVPAPASVNLDKSTNYFPEPRQNTHLITTPFMGYTSFWDEGTNVTAVNVTNRINAWLANGLYAAYGSNKLAYMFDVGVFTSRAADGTLTNTGFAHGFAGLISFAHANGFLIGTYLRAAPDSEPGAWPLTQGTNIYFDIKDLKTKGWDIVKVDNTTGGLAGQRQTMFDFAAALETYPMFFIRTIDAVNWPPFNTATFGNIPYSIFESVNEVQSSQMFFCTTFAQVSDNVMHFGTNGYLTRPGHFFDAPGFDATSAPTNVAIVALTWHAILSANLPGLDDPSAANIVYMTNAGFRQVWQDSLVGGGLLITNNAFSQVWAKPMSNNRYAVGVFNMVTNSSTNITFNLNLLNPFITSADVYDAWKGVDLGVSNTTFTANSIVTNGCGMYIVTPQIGSVVSTSVGYNCTSTNWGNITSTGYTNVNLFAVEIHWSASTGVSVTNIDAGGNAWSTNASLTGATFYTTLASGAKIKAPSGLTGNWHAKQ